MSNYPLIKRYLPELLIECTAAGKWEFYIKCSDLESALQKATVVYGTKDKEAGYAHTDNIRGLFSHQGLLLGYQPIEKPLEPVSKDELIAALEFVEEKVFTDGGSNGQERKIYNMSELLERIKKAGVK